MSNYKFQDDYPVEEMGFKSFTDYQDFTATTDKAGTNLNTILGMAGEVGEILAKAEPYLFSKQVPDVGTTVTKLINAARECESMKKRTRVEKLEAVNLDNLSQEQKEALADEAGDVVWYLARFCDRLGQDFGQVVQRNVEKLTSRKKRGVLHSKGDKR